MIQNRGVRKGVLIVGDSLPTNQFTLKNINSVLDPRHTVYNSLIVPIKYYLNNYLNSFGYRLPMEECETDFIYYINAVQDPRTKIKPDLSELEREVIRPDHKIILSMGSFAFRCVDVILNPNNKIKKSYSIEDLGNEFRKRIFEYRPKLHLPILHNVANLRFERTKDFIVDDGNNYISYFHYVGVSLGKLLLNHKEEFNFIQSLVNK
jgi:hypothetical protein